MFWANFQPGKRLILGTQKFYRRETKTIFLGIIWFKKESWGENEETKTERRQRN